MTKDEVKKLRMDSPESLQFLNNATEFYNLMMMYRCAIREIQTKLEVLDDEFSAENLSLIHIFARDEPDMDFQNYKRNIKSHFYTCNIKTSGVTPLSVLSHTVMPAQ